jgi:ion channel-forming bestrophin family protein
MLVDGATTLRTLFLQYCHKVLIMILIAVAVEIGNDYINFQRSVLSFASVGLLATALSFFLVFRVNEAYSRWWEARTLWGGIVNSSRSFAHQATSMLETPREQTAEAEDVICWQRELVYRHLAFIHALRMSLRRETDWGSLEPYLAPAELEEVKRLANKPTQLLKNQTQRLMEARQKGLLDGFCHLMLDGTLRQLSDLQGGCERIKTTVFPDSVAFFTRVVAWGIAVAIPICLIDVGNTFDLFDFVAVPLMMLAPMITERLGAELKNPFEGLPNDTPMTAICRTIEIDLREQLGETDLPEPLKPVNGVLM